MRWFILYFTYAGQGQDVRRQTTVHYFFLEASRLCLCQNIVVQGKMGVVLKRKVNSGWTNPLNHLRTKHPEVIEVKEEAVLGGGALTLHAGCRDHTWGKIHMFIDIMKTCSNEAQNRQNRRIKNAQVRESNPRGTCQSRVSRPLRQLSRYQSRQHFGQWNA